MYFWKGKTGSLWPSSPRDVLHRSYYRKHSPLRNYTGGSLRFWNILINQKSLKKLTQVGTTSSISGTLERVPSQVQSLITKATKGIYFSLMDVLLWTTNHNLPSYCPVYDILLVTYLWNTCLVRHHTTSLGCSSVLWIFALKKFYRTKAKPGLSLWASEQRVSQLHWELQSVGSRARTQVFMLARQVPCQLSYLPSPDFKPVKWKL